MEKKPILQSKIPAMITYIIAVISLFAGLLIPLNVNSFTEGIRFGEMPLLQFEGALFKLGLLKNISLGAALSPAFSFEVTAFGTTFDLGAILLIVYSLAVVFALVMLLPVCIASKTKPHARRLAVTAEVIVLLVLFALAVCDLGKETANLNLSVLIPLAVTALMLILQSVIYFRSSGAVKVVIFIISVLAVFVAIGNITATIPATSAPIDAFWAKIQGRYVPVLGLYSIGEATYFGSSLIFGRLPLVPAADPLFAIINTIGLIVCLLVCLNIILDIVGLGKRTTSATVTFNFIRYITEFTLNIILFGAIIGFGGSVGLNLVVVTILSLSQLVIVVMHRAIYKWRVKRAYKTEKVNVAADADQPQAVAEPVAIQPIEVDEIDAEPVAIQPVEVDEVNAGPVAIQPVEVAETAATTATEVIAEPVYNGPTDRFIEKLTTLQKIEFSKLFLDENSYNFADIPDYVVGGDNSKFFSSIFIFLARVRDYISDGLMDKLHEEVQLI